MAYDKSNGWLRRGNGVSWRDDDGIGGVRQTSMMMSYRKLAHRVRDAMIYRRNRRQAWLAAALSNVDAAAWRHVFAVTAGGISGSINITSVVRITLKRPQNRRADLKQAEDVKQADNYAKK